VAQSAKHRVTVQAQAWDQHSGRYVATDQAIETDAEKLEKVRSNSTSNRFLKGPVPWDWLIRASRLPGRALVVGLCLWRLKGATRNNTIKLSNTELEPFGIDRAAKSRGLTALEGAGLIKVDHIPGRWSSVTLLT
jgi:hypothetical protein